MADLDPRARRWRRAWLGLTALLAASACDAALGLDDYTLAGPGECVAGSAGCEAAAGAGGGGGEVLCQEQGRTLRCGPSPRAPGQSCGACPAGQSCTSDQLACVRPGETYCGQGLVCAQGQSCGAGVCAATTCAGLGLVCGPSPATGEPCGQCPGGSSCAPDQRSCQGPAAACVAQGLVCGPAPDTGEPCGQCPDGASCAPDQRACVGAGETYCGQGQVCVEGQACFNGSCRSAAEVCAAFELVCGVEPQSGLSCGQCPSGQKCASPGKKCIPAATKTCGNGQECSVIQACPSMSGGLCATFCEGRPLRCGVVPDPNDSGQTIDCGQCQGADTCQAAVVGDGTRGCAPPDRDYCGADLLCAKGRCYLEDGQGLAKCCPGSVTVPLDTSGQPAPEPPRCCDDPGAQSVKLPGGGSGCCPSSTPFPCPAGSPQTCCASPP